MLDILSWTLVCHLPQVLHKLTAYVCLETQVITDYPGKDNLALSTLPDM